MVISKLSTVARLMPSRVVRAVSVMKTDLALVTPVVKVSDCRAFRVVHEMAPTWDSDGNSKLDMVVKLVNLMVPLMEPRSVADRAVSLTALLAIKSPLICWMPPREIPPEGTSGEI